MSDIESTKVLIVDDEESIRLSLTAFLDDLDYDVVSVDSAEKALDILKDRSFHIAIVDLRLPVMSGDAMILEANKIIPSLKYIIHTGSVGYNPSDNLKAIGISSNNVIFKPIHNLEIITEAIEKLLKNQ